MCSKHMGMIESLNSLAKCCVNFKKQQFVSNLKEHAQTLQNKVKKAAIRWLISPSYTHVGNIHFLIPGQDGFLVIHHLLLML